MAAVFFVLVTTPNYTLIPSSSNQLIQYQLARYPKTERYCLRRLAPGHQYTLSIDLKTL
jgi:hypothetical protein